MLFLFIGIFKEKYVFKKIILCFTSLIIMLLYTASVFYDPAQLFSEKYPKHYIYDNRFLLEKFLIHMTLIA